MKKIYLSLVCLCLLAIQAITAQTFTPIDIYPGILGSDPLFLTSLNGKVYMRATGDVSTGAELWVSDGTPAGTSLLKDIWAGPGSSSPHDFMVVGNKLYFYADDSVHGAELWVTDGTPAGTVMVQDINPGINSSEPGYLTPFGGKLYFTADDGTHGTELWVSDGTSSGTSMVKDISPGSSSSSPFGIISTYAGVYYSYQFNVWNNKMYFRATDDVHGTELWVSDGTTLGTTLVADIRPGPGSSEAYWMTPIGSGMVFGANDSVHGTELWYTDGTGPGTTLLKDITPGTVSSQPGGVSGFVPLNGKVYFNATEATTGAELWVTDGTTAGTVLVKDILPGPGSSDAGYYGMIPFNGRLYMAANDSINGLQLWSTDGTTAGTSLLKVLATTTPYASAPRNFIVYNNRLLFVAAPDATSGAQLWSSDGTGTGTNIVQPAIAPNPDPLSNANPCVSNGMLFMNAGYNSIGYELWIYSTPLGISETSGDHAISAYPNPFSSSVSLSGLVSSEQYAVKVMDATGREYYSTEIDHPAQTATISLPNLSTGVYVLQVSGLSSQTFKLVKQ